ncbi:Defensin-like protein [Cucumis melo var. makuwa]|uniref:Defensin-like protein n=1 Tax=Cucumis melo var. makuwa TaxID=1194695 RepID=A0A5A7V205_CUCMM|nr:Defensin-like protein [Cucumis melo var. makuwa]
MKSVSFSAILLALLLIFSGETMMKSVEGVGGLCEKAVHGRGCKEAECMSGCKALFGKVAMGLWFFFRTPSDTCLCRYPC